MTECADASNIAPQRALQTQDALAKEARERDAAIIYVRDPEEYAQGYVPSAANVPLASIGQAADVIPGKDTAIYAYCLSDVHSARACSQLKSAGFTAVVNAGSIRPYRGPVENVTPDARTSRAAGLLPGLPAHNSKTEQIQANSI